jgi:hypothetical protein
MKVLYTYSCIKDIYFLEYSKIVMMTSSEVYSIWDNIKIYLRERCSRDSSVSIAIKLRAGWPRNQCSIPDTGNTFLLHDARTGSGARPVSYVMSIRALSPWVKRPGREAEYSPPAAAELKSEWIYTSTSPYIFKAWCLIERRDFTLHLL